MPATKASTIEGAVLKGAEWLMVPKASRFLLQTEIVKALFD